MNKSAVITGSNKGIGKAMTEAFAEHGYNIYACARKQNDEFEKWLSELSAKYNIHIKPVYFDLSDENEVKRGISDILKEKQHIDVLINNAAVAHGALFTMTSLSKLREVYEINVFAQIQIMQLIARQMMRQKSGCIINICSAGGIETNPGYLAYGSSKAALTWITKSVSRELGAYNIRVNGIAPGLIETEMGNYKSEEEKQKVVERTSLKRTGNPKDIANAALYIVSDEAAFMTGHILVVDGGRVQ